MYSYSRNKYKRVIVVLCFIAFLDTFGYSVVIPLIPFISKQFSASDLTIGLIFAVYSVCQLLAAPVLGRLSDIYGKKLILIFSLLGSIIGFACLGLAHSVTLILVSRLIDGVTAGNALILNAIILDIYPTEDHTKKFAWISTAVGAGILSGPIVGSLLSRNGLQIPALFALGLSVLAVIVTIVFLSDQNKAARSSSLSLFSPRNYFEVFNKNKLGSILRIDLLHNIILNGFLLAFPLYVNKLLSYNAKQSGVTITILFTFGFLFQIGILQILIKKFKELELLKAGIFIYLLGFLCLLFTRHSFLVILFSCLVMAGIVLINPLINTLIARSNKSSAEGELMGISQYITSLGQIIGPLLAYAVISAGHSIGFIILFIILTLFGLSLIYRHSKVYA